MTRRTAWWRSTVAALALAGVAACGSGVGASEDQALDRATAAASGAADTTGTTSAPSTSTTAPSTTAPSTTSTTAAPTSTTPPPRPHVLHEQPWTPFATVGPVTLHHPSDRVEAIGFHQSGHDGAQQQDPVDGAASWFTMESRDRDTGPQGAADVVIEPGREIRAPVTGTVVRAGTYTLYCDYVDQYAVIDPDARPGWEVKVLHVEGLVLAAGQRVEAGVTPLAAQARVLPFASQVEDHTGEPPWPHVHIEVVDPSVPDRPTGPGCS